MRQAGRYLPEFRDIRIKNPNFINLCLNSELSSEITLQPIKRFDLDSAIIFSDILMVPFALGQKVNFIKNKGPILDNFNLKIFLSNDKISFTQKLYPVYKAIEITRKKLDKKKSLISFIGAPWTLLIYMLGAKQSKSEIDRKKIESNEFEVNVMGERIRDVKQNMKSENKVYCGDILYGMYKRGKRLIKNPFEIKTLKVIKEMRDENVSYNKIANYLNDMEIPSKNKSIWYSSSVKSVYQNGVIEMLEL